MMPLLLLQSRTLISSRFARKRMALSLNYAPANDVGCPCAGAVIAAHPLPFTVSGILMVSGPYLPGSSAATMPLTSTAA
jgi:hypothetical protein